MFQTWIVIKAVIFSSLLADHPHSGLELFNTTRVYATMDTVTVIHGRFEDSLKVWHWGNITLDTLDVPFAEDKGILVYKTNLTASEVLDH